MAVTIFYANKDIEDIGVLKGFKLDMSISTETGENNYEVRTAIGGVELDEGYFIYAENSEYGGIVDTKRINTKDKTLYYSGRTWRGMLESKIIVPPANQDYYKVSGDLNEVLADIIDDFGLDDLFYASTTLTGETVTNYQFYRYTDAYSGILRLLSSVDYKLSIEFDTIAKKCKLEAIPIIDYGQYQEITSDHYDFDISKVSGTVNHLIGLGSGELKDRMVLHLYADADGEISETQTLFGKDEVVSIYDYGNAQDEDDLRENMLEEFKNLIGSDNIKITLNDINADVGDKITAHEEITGIEAVQYIEGKVITIDDDTMKVQYSARTIQTSVNGEIVSGEGRTIVVEDTLESTSRENALSANMGKELKSLLDSVKNDYVIEQGTSGDWTYRKWNSGLAECWYSASLGSVAITSAWGSTYYYNVSAVNYPITFIAKPIVIPQVESGSGNAWISYDNNGNASRTSYFPLYASKSGTYACRLNLYVIGKWK